MLSSDQNLSSLTLYRSHCHSSLNNYLCYLSSAIQIRLIEFSSLSEILSSTVINIPQEPVKAVCLQGCDSVLYVGVAFISRYAIYTKKGENIMSSILPLDKNISIFTEGYFGVERWEMGLAFARTTGELKIFNLKEQKEVTKVPQNREEEFYTSMVIYKENLYLGRDDGKIECHQITQQNYLKLQALDATTSKYPIVNLVYDSIHQQLFTTTFEGQLLIYSENLNHKSIISAHHSNISRLHLGSGNQVISSGEDGLVHVFQIQEKRHLKPIKTLSSDRLVSLLFTINNKNCLVYYQDAKIKFI